MKVLTAILVCSITLWGCSFNQLQNDLADNQFFEKTKHADASASYIGEWALDTYKWRKIIKIRNNGRVKVVLSPDFGASEGKVYLDKGRPFLILKDGTKAEIVSSESGHLLIESYGQQEGFASMLNTNKYN